jgi:hypothetical protein
MIGLIVAGAVLLVVGAAVAVTYVATRLRYQCTCYTPRHGRSGEQTHVQEMPQELSALMDPAGPTRPDIRWELTS